MALAELVVQAFQATLRAGELPRRGQLHPWMRKEQSLLLDALAEVSHRLPQAAMPRGRLHGSVIMPSCIAYRVPTTMARHMLAAVRLIHPAPAFAVTLLSAVLGAILLAQEGRPIDERWWLTVLAVAGSQVFTGATNDLADAARDDAAGRTEKPIPAGEVSQNLALWLASAGLAVQVAASAWLGALTLVLGLGAVASAAAYNLALSRTPLLAAPLPDQLRAAAAMGRRGRGRAAGACRPGGAAGGCLRGGRAPGQHAPRLRQRCGHRLALPGAGHRPRDDAGAGHRAGAGGGPGGRCWRWSRAVGQARRRWRWVRSGWPASASGRWASVGCGTGCWWPRWPGPRRGPSAPADRARSCPRSRDPPRRLPR